MVTYNLLSSRSALLLVLITMPPHLRAQGPKPIPILDQKGKPTGIEYMVSRTELIQVKKGGPPVNLLTPISIANNTKNDQRVVFCATGESKGLNGTFEHMKVQMIVVEDKVANTKTFTCEIPGQKKEQNLKARMQRLGSMGCRLIAIKAGKTAEANFASGNDRTIPKFKEHLPVQGEFKLKGECAGIGPAQTGKVGSGIANVATCGKPWGQVGGHPPGILKKLGSLELKIIVFQDAALRLAVSADKPRDKGKDFNCNKCFGMGDDLDDFSGYDLALPDETVRKDLKAIFADHWITYDKLELNKNTSKTLSLNLYNDATYFAENSTLVEYSIQQVYSSSGCAITHLSVPPDTPFLIAPQELATLEAEVACNSSTSPNIEGYLTLTLTQVDNDEILSQDFMWMGAGPSTDLSDNSAEAESGTALH